MTTDSFICHGQYALIAYHIRNNMRGEIHYYR